jgi:hypothetical protein
MEYLDQSNGGQLIKKCLSYPNHGKRKATNWMRAAACFKNISRTVEHREYLAEILRNSPGTPSTWVTLIYSFKIKHGVHFCIYGVLGPRGEHFLFTFSPFTLFEEWFLLNGTSTVHRRTRVPHIATTTTTTTIPDATCFFFSFGCVAYAVEFWILNGTVHKQNLIKIAVDVSNKILFYDWTFDVSSLNL